MREENVDGVVMTYIGTAKHDREPIEILVVDPLGPITLDPYAPDAVEDYAAFKGISRSEAQREMDWIVDWHQEGKAKYEAHVDGGGEA